MLFYHSLYLKLSTFHSNSTPCLMLYYEQKFLLMVILFKLLMLQNFIQLFQNILIISILEGISLQDMSDDFGEIAALSTIHLT